MLQDSPEPSRAVRLGTYQHFKGGTYEVLGVATHSETLETVVVYRHVEQAGSERVGADLWVRPISMFFESVEYKGVRTPRFKFLTEQAPGVSLGGREVEYQSHEQRKSEQCGK